MAMFEIPYLYRVRAVPRGHQNPKDACSLGTVAVRIEEIAAVDAPPAARLLNQEGETLRTYRALRDGLGAPVGGRRAGERGFRPWSPEEVAALLANRGFPAIRLFQRQSFAEWPAPLVRGREHVREWIWDDRAEVEAKVLREVRGAAFVGGALYRATRGPTWSIEGVRLEEEPVELRAHFGLDDGDRSNSWRGDRKDAAVAAAAAIHPRGEVRVVGDIEVLRPDAFSWDDDHALLRDACRDLIDATGRHIHRWPTSAIQAWTALRDHLPVWPASRDGGTLTLARQAYAAATAPGREPDDPGRWPFRPAGMAAALARMEDEAPAPAPALAGPAL